MPKEKREKELCQPPRQHQLCVCAFTYAHMWNTRPVFFYVNVWFYMILWICASIFIQPHICVGVFGMLHIPCGHTMSAAPVSSLNSTMPARSEQGERCQAVDEGRRGAISLLVTHSSMQTTSPQGRNQKAGPLTPAEREGGGSAKQCKIWPF